MSEKRRMRQRWNKSMLGDMLSEWRETHGKTQTSLAEALSVHPSTLSTLERGGYASAALLRRIAKYTGLDEHQVFVAAGRLPPQVEQGLIMKWEEIGPQVLALLED